MSFNFLIKNSEINSKDDINTIISRITSSFGNNIEGNIILESENCLVKNIGENKYLECYKININESDNPIKNEYFINMLNIDETEKNTVIEVMSSDRLYKDNLVVLDLLSHEFIKKELENLLKFEENLKAYFVLSLLKEYEEQVYNIIDSFKTKENLIELPQNIKYNLQKIELTKIVEFIIENPLGGKEYEIYYNEYLKNKDEDLSKMREIFRKNIFSELKSDLETSRSKIKEYRNILSHNRFLNCNLIKDKHCAEISSILEKMIKINNKTLKELLCTDEVENEQNDKKERLTLILKNQEEVNLEILIIKILAELGYIYIKDNIKRKDDLYEYETEEKDLSLKIRKISENSINNIYLLDIKFKLSNDNNLNLNETLIYKLKNFEVIICFDSLSRSNSLILSDKLSICENLLRKYISIFQYIEGINNNNNKDTMFDSVRIGHGGKIFNTVYDYDFIELIKVIESPNNTSKGIDNLKKELGKAIKDNNFSKIELLLNNMLVYNTELKTIMSNWCELYKYRTRIVHCQVMFYSELPKIKDNINKIKSIIENILTEYINEVCNFVYQPLELQILKIDKNIKDKNKLDLIFIKDNSVYRIENSFLFRINYIINSILGQEKEEYVYSLEILKEKIKYNITELENFIKCENFEMEISKILEKLGLCNYADFRIISSEKQKLEEKIGKLLSSIDNKKI
ncbi:hypothetical protein ACSXC4_05130 [Clostridium perfringens]|uniref:Uncharacterized protein n=8 Tax=Clostridium perfringens TaxID=1502 RepID=A0A127EIM6_CLOPF|nr:MULTISPECIES: hypothetical protein [Clostridium]AMN35782.1 hypothetical protein JFP838_08485 [Clostridium perfringens]MDK7588262.1 hypothetical protein [Clostridium sp. UMB9555B]MDK7627399.1 hypothetical protein [Clostridium sp. UMB9555A]